MILLKRKTTAIVFYFETHSLDNLLYYLYGSSALLSIFPCLSPFLSVAAPLIALHDSLYIFFFSLFFFYTYLLISLDILHMRTSNVRPSLFVPLAQNNVEMSVSPHRILDSLIRFESKRKPSEK